MQVAVATSTHHLRNETIQQWDRLAIHSDQPFASPHWLLPWWKHASPRSAGLRIVTVSDQDQLAAVLPLFVEKTALGQRYRFLGSGASPTVDIVANEHAINDTTWLRKAMAALQPSPRAVIWDGTPEASPWPDQMKHQWEGGGALSDEFGMRIPRLTLSYPSFDDWYQSKSRNFRQKTKQQSKRLSQSDARFELLERPASWADEIQTFAQLHRAVWDRKGGSSVLRPGMEAALVDAAEALAPHGRFFVWKLVFGERAVSSAIFFAAGQVLSYWLGGYDPEWARFQPGLMTLIRAIEHAYDGDYELLDLGPGAQSYKYRLSDNETRATWHTTSQHGFGHQTQRLHLANSRARMALADTLPEDLKNRLKRIRRWTADRQSH